MTWSDLTAMVLCFNKQTVQVSNSGVQLESMEAVLLQPYMYMLGPIFSEVGISRELKNCDKFDLAASHCSEIGIMQQSGGNVPP